MFVGALFIIAANLEQSKYPSTREGKQTVRHQYNGRVLSSKKETTDICNKDESEKLLS